MGNIRSRFLGNLIHNSSLYNFRENWKRGWDNVGFDPFSFYIFILIVSPLMQCYCLFSFSKEREVFRDFFLGNWGIQILFVLRFVENFFEDERKMNQHCQFLIRVLIFVRFYSYFCIHCFYRFTAFFIQFVL